MIRAALNAYSGTLNDWALEVSKKMIEDASSADYSTWLKIGEKISRQTRTLLKETGVSTVYSSLQNEQVTLIKSLPLEASQKVHEWVKDGLAKNERYDVIMKRIQTELYPITKSRATCIARTETARARTNFTQARARAVGSPGYIWRTVGDGRVRHMHEALDGTYHTWDNPPICDIGKGGQPIRSAPGCVFNCRCWPEPVWPEELQR